MDEDKSEQLLKELAGIHNELEDLNRGVSQIIEGEGSSSICDSLDEVKALLRDILAVLEKRAK